MLAAVAGLVACGGNNYYFDKVENKTYNDPTAELDSLSYALGTSLGLGLNFNQGFMGEDVTPLKEAISAELATSDIDQEKVVNNREWITRFNNERLRPYRMAKQLKMFTKDTTALPEIFNEEFTKERVMTALGHDMGNFLRNSGAQLNMHWLFSAMDEAMLVPENVILDSLFKIPAMDMQRLTSDYFNNKLPELTHKHATQWLKSISERSGVWPLAVKEDTLYYRIIDAGNDHRVKSEKDSVTFYYEVYTRTGGLVESTSQRLTLMRDALDKVNADTTLKADVRAKRVADIEAEIAKAERPTTPLNQFRIAGAIEALKLIGEGGEMIMWIPSSLAYGARGNRQVNPHEAIVMHVRLERVAEAPLIKPISKKEMMRPERPLKPTPLKPTTAESVKTEK